MNITKYPQFKHSYLLMLFIVLSVSSLPVSAESDFSGLYSGFQYSTSDLKLSNTSAASGHIKAKLGKHMNDIFSAEGQLGLTTDTDNNDDIFTYGGYIRASKDYGKYKPYALIGFSGLYSSEDSMDSLSGEVGGSLGIGLEIFGTKDITVTFEYLRLLDKTIDGENVTFDTLGIGFTYYFTEEKSYFNKNRNKIRSIRY